MSELEEKLNVVLNNPDMMQQIISMAQSLSSTQQEAPVHQNVPNEAQLPAPELKLLQTMFHQGSIDSNQKALLLALSPYLSGERVQKLERAMQAARMAGTASRFLNTGGLQMLTGRGSVV